MTKIAIVPPMKTKTRGGFDATIFEIDSSDLGDGINGRIDTPGMGPVHKSWNDGGMCRDAGSECSLDPHSAEVADVIKRLGDLRAP